jgi:hypothetical protein
MPHHDMINWSAGAVVVLLAVLFVGLRPPRHAGDATAAGVAEWLRWVRRAFVVIGVLLSAGAATVAVCSPREETRPPRAMADSLHFLNAVVDSAVRRHLRDSVALEKSARHP